MTTIEFGDRVTMTWLEQQARTSRRVDKALSLIEEVSVATTPLRDSAYQEGFEDGRRDLAIELRSILENFP